YERNSTMKRVGRFATTLAISGALAASGLGLGVAAAQPNTSPYQAVGTQWCPGQALPFSEIRWDMSVGHTWYIVGMGTGNVKMVDLQEQPFDSWISADIPAPVFDPPPPPAPLPPGTPFCSPRGSLFIIGPICDEIGVDLPPGSVKH